MCACKMYNMLRIIVNYIFCSYVVNDVSGMCCMLLKTSYSGCSTYIRMYFVHMC